jgi:hypothetical protein
MSSMEAGKESIHQTKASNYIIASDVLQVRPRMQWVGTVRVDNCGFLNSGQLRVSKKFDLTWELESSDTIILITTVTCKFQALGFMVAAFKTAM